VPREVRSSPLHSRQSTGALRNLSFFEGWTDDELEHFERIVGCVRFAPGDVLILVSGEAEVTRNGTSLLRLHPGDHAGELALLDDSPAAATVVARSDGEALSLYQRDFHNLLETIPSLGRRILATLARWFRKTQGLDS
jgi:CRP-like cAMP-binding protein